MHPSLFEKTIQFLTGNFHVVLLEDYLHDPLLYKREKTLATISFDDGYKDNLEVAAPILLHYRCPASFYIVTECIDKNLPTWTYITDHFFQQDGHNRIRLENDFVPDLFRVIKWENMPEGSEWGKKIKPWMKSLSNPQRLWVMEQLKQQGNGSEKLPDNMMMNWNNIRELLFAGFYIGSHSHTHPMLASLPEQKEIENELTLSALRIQENLEQKPLTISYPIGNWDERVIDIAMKAGYHYGLAVEQSFYRPGV